MRRFCANRRSAHRRDGSGSGARNRRDGAVRRKIRRQSARGLDRHASARSCAAARTSRRTGDIGICKIVYEGSISAGVRRIEAITGEGALQRFQEAQTQLARVAGIVHAPKPSWSSRSKNCWPRRSRWSMSLQQLKTKVAQAQAGELESQAREIKGVKVLAAQVDGFDRAQLRTLVDSLRNKWKTRGGRAGHGARIPPSPSSAGVTKDLTGEGSRGQAGGSGGAGGGRQGRRPAGHGGGGRQGSVRACRRARRRCTQASRGCCRTRWKRLTRRRCRHRGRRAHRAWPAASS